MSLSSTLSGFQQDLRYAFRLWRKHPLTTVLCIAALAIGIGAASAIFSIVNAVLVQPLPYREPERLVMLWNVNERDGFDIDQMKKLARSLSGPEYHDWRTRSEVFEDVMGFTSGLMRITHTDDPGAILVYQVTSGAFPMMGVTPLIGRGFEPQEERPGADPVIVLQHEVWQQRYRGDPSIIGQKMYLFNRPHTVIGVMPPEFVLFNRQMDAMVPAQLPDVQEERFRGGRAFRALARLKPGLTLEQAQARADAFSATLAHEHPQTNTNWRVVLVPAAEDATNELRPAMLLLMAAVGCVVLITCANVASLLLVQASARSRELALRTAIGANRLRLVRQMLLEGLTLAVAGGVLGLWIAYGLVRFFQDMLPDRTTHGKYLVQAVALKVDSTVVGFTIGVTLLSALIFGLIPAWRASRPDISESLKDNSRGSIGRSRDRSSRHALVVCEVALAALLAVGASLLVRSVVALYDQGPGFRAEGLVSVAGITLSWEEIDNQVRRDKLSREQAEELYTAADRSFRDRLYRELDKIPRLAYTTATRLPLSGTYGLSTLMIDARPQPADDEQGPQAIISVVGDRYFKVMGIPLLKGRDFGPQDGPGALPTVIVSQDIVRRYFAAEDPIGRRIKFGRLDSQPWFTIVGVVGDVREDGMDQPPQPVVYSPESQSAFAGRIIFRAQSGDTMAFVPAVRQALRTADPNAGVYRIVRLQDEARGSAWKLNYSALLLTGLAALAVLLAILGVYGLLSYAVRERTQEIGVRMAMGADRGQVIAPIVREGVLLVAVGVSIGLLGAAGLTRFLSSLLFGVASLDPGSFTGVALLLLLAGVLASYVPARRAAQFDPLVALRDE